MSNNSSGTLTNQDRTTIPHEYHQYTIVVECEYLPGKALLTPLSEPFKTSKDAALSLSYLSDLYPSAKIRAERFYV